MNSTLLKNIKYKYAQLIAECENNYPTAETKRYAINKLNKIVGQITSPRPHIHRWK